MAITLESISFNHDPNSATNDALTIRTNQSANVNVPEWTSGMTRPEQSPAAYIANRISANRLTIEATFRRAAGDNADVGISAVGVNGVQSHVLGDVKAKTIHFVGDLVTASFELNSPATNPGVGRWDIGWVWSLGNTNQTTNHRIYTILDSPQEPWGQPGSSFQLPWTEVLDHACEAAKGATTLDDAAAMLTTWAYALGDSKLKYNEEGSGSSCFTLEGMNTFLCTDFLGALRNGNGTRRGVNCTDCATILSCFANILGCRLSQSKIGFEFYTNLLRKIGLPNLGSQEFSFHEVAWKFPATGNPTVFDCCVQLDGDGIRNDDNFLPTLGINLPMGDPTGNDYRGRLIRPTRRGIESREWPGTRITRRIDDGGTLTPRNLEQAELDLLAEEHDFPSWNAVPPKPKCESKHKKKVKAKKNGSLPAENPPMAVENSPGENSSTPTQALFLKNYKFSKDQDAVAGWKPGAPRTYKAEPDPVRVTEVVWSSSEACSSAALRVITYECKSLESARSFLLRLLAEFHMPGIKRRDEFTVDHKKVKIGDVAFAGPDELVLLFARANNVIFMQSVGKTPVSAAQLAHEIDDDIAGPDPQQVPESDKGEFRVAGEKITVGDEIFIHSEAKSEAQAAESKTNKEPTLIKFLTPAGQVFQKGDDLCYRPLVAGEQSITILDCKAGNTTRQELKLIVEPAPESEDECSKPDKEEETEMPDTIDLTGVWSSIRPTNNGVDSADMSVDGIIEITETDSATGEIKGFYRNEERLSETRLLSGEITAVGSDLILKLNHPLGVGRKRNYVGKLVASDNQVKIVAGRYYDETVVNGNGAPVPVADPAPAPEVPTTTTSFSVTAANGQENGTWVATKP